MALTNGLFWLSREALRAFDGSCFTEFAEALRAPTQYVGLDAGFDPMVSPPYRSGAWYCTRCNVGAMLGEKMHRCADLNRLPALPVIRTISMKDIEFRLIDATDEF